MSINRITVKDFGPFDELNVKFSPGLNVILGDNGTGKTFLLKLLYAATATTADQTKDFWRKLAWVFNLGQVRLAHLIRYGRPSGTLWVGCNGGAALEITIPSKGKVVVKVEGKWQSGIGSVYIPTEDVLAQAPDYAGILIPALETPAFADFFAVVELEKALGGKVVVEGERFYLKSGKAKLEFAMVSEGIRRLALLWLLVHNGSIQPGSVLFWDLPETGLNNKFKHIIASALAEFASDGVQVIVTTNSLFMLREFEIETSKRHYSVRYINLQKTESGVQAEQADSPAEVGLISALEESLLQSDRYMEV